MVPFWNWGIRSRACQQSANGAKRKLVEHHREGLALRGISHASIKDVPPVHARGGGASLARLHGGALLSSSTCHSRVSPLFSSSARLIWDGHVQLSRNGVICAMTGIRRHEQATIPTAPVRDMPTESSACQAPWIPVPLHGAWLGFPNQRWQLLLPCTYLGLFLKGSRLFRNGNLDDLPHLIAVHLRQLLLLLGMLQLALGLRQGLRRKTSLSDAEGLDCQ